MGQKKSRYRVVFSEKQEIGADMFSLSVIPGILPAKPEKTVTVEIRNSPAARTPLLAIEEQSGVSTRIPERTSVGMKKDKVKQMQDPAAPEKGEQSLELILLYEQYKRPIHSYVYRLLGSQEDADDLTQEVFMRAFVSWNELYDHHNLSPWLYRIATNLCVDQLRRRKRISWWPLVRRHPVDAPFERGSEEDASYLPSDSGGIPEVFERDHIRLALASMPEDYAIVLVLSAAQGVPYQDIAQIIGISPNAAATRISRAKRMFAEQYQRLSDENLSQQEG
jgi:RNA polymerase sigma-70 factor, ECF subfamily